jgi:hypothetical protein
MRQKNKQKEQKDLREIFSKPNRYKFHSDPDIRKSSKKK